MRPVQWFRRRGSGYTQAAIESVFPGFGASFVALAILFFAFTTIVAYYYMAETNLEYIARNRAPAWSILLLKLLIMAVGRLRRRVERGRCLGARQRGRRHHGVAQHHRDPDHSEAGAARAARLRGAEEARVSIRRSIPTSWHQERRSLA